VPRLARVVFPAYPHHVTQRGNRRAQVFFSPSDYRSYLELLRDYTERHSVTVLAYCLMPNHVHLVLVPQSSNGLHRVMLPVNMRYAQRFNRERDLVGVVWQGRYFSSVLDGGYLRNAIRYVELNPVRSNLVARPENYEWSSAPVHCARGTDGLLAMNPWYERLLAGIADWRAWLTRGLDREALDTLRRNSAKGLPCGSAEFIEGLEKLSGRILRVRKRGRRGKLGKN
jgi:putative transposase